MADVEFKRFKRLLKNNGYFVTAPRMTLFGLLQNNPALTLSKLIKLLNSHDQSTVYRNIKLFEKLGIINKLRLGWNTKIELSDMFKHHHHHLTCLKCGKIIALKENKIIEQQLEELAKQLNFRPTDHQLEIRGYCQKCKQI